MEKIFEGLIFEYSDGRTYHLGIRGDEVSTYILTMGSARRLEMLGELLEDARRGGERLNWVSGYYGDIKVFGFTTGMGIGSALISVTEALKKISEGVGQAYMVRLGTAGALQDIPRYSIVVASSVVRNEAGTSHIIFPGYPADMDPAVYLSLLDSAVSRGWVLGRNLFLGKVETKDDLYFQEGFHNSPQGEESRRRYRAMREMGVLATEMEASSLPILRDYFRKRFGAKVFVGAALLILRGIDERLGDMERELVMIGLEGLSRLDRFLRGEASLDNILRYISS